MRGLDLSFRHDSWLAALPRSPLDDGRVAGLVVRPSAGERVRPEEVELEPGVGVVGDRRANDPPEERGVEVSLMNVHVLRAVAGDDPERMALAGDNLLVDLDLSEANLPAGTELAIGEALLRVSPMPHRPCAKFAARFGELAAKRVARAGRTGLRGRGVLCDVVRGGRVRVGDAIRKRG